MVGRGSGGERAMPTSEKLLFRDGFPAEVIGIYFSVI